MLSLAERLEAFWSGDILDRIPFTTYSNKIPPDWSDPVIQQMFADGLGVVRFMPTWRVSTREVEFRRETSTSGGDSLRRDAWHTPVGTITATWKNDWQQTYFLETPADYRVMTYVVERTDAAPAYAPFEAAVAAAPDYMVYVPRIGRTPLQTMLVDYAGLANFAVHLYEYADEVHALYEALRRTFRRLVAIVAEGPGRYINVIENFSAETLGPRRYARYLLPVYEETFGMLHEAGKVVGCHYDGMLKSVKELVARAPLDMIESFTPPPEGDMTLAEARAAWPDKLLWSNINLGCYELPPDQLRAAIAARVAAGAPDRRRLAFEVSEAQPPRWRESMPVILDVLKTL